MVWSASSQVKESSYENQPIVSLINGGGIRDSIPEGIINRGQVKDEIFAPVLSIVRVNTLEEAIELTNQSEFANGACLYTDSAKAVREFREEIDAGMLGVNLGVPAPMAFFPFSGYKSSFYGDLRSSSNINEKSGRLH